MKRSSIIFALLTLCLLLPTLAFAQSSTDDGDNDCRDAAGAPIACPTDEPRPEEPAPQPEPRPEEPAPQPQDPEPQPEPEPEPEQPDSTAVNPLRPTVGGDCQIATFASGRVNVRDFPSFEAPIIDTLSPDMLYDVYALAFVDDEVWYLVDSGWASGVATVLGGDCGGTSRVSYVPQLMSIDLSALDEELAAYCYDILGLEICFGTGPVVYSDGSMGGPGPDATPKKVPCSGLKGAVICYIIEKIADAIIDWWLDEDDMQPFDSSDMPEILTVGLDTDTVPVPDCVGRFYCPWVNALQDWFTRDGDELIFDPFRSTIFIPPNNPGTDVGDPADSDGGEYPYCHALLNRFIFDQIPDDGSSPMRNEIVNGYLVVSVELRPDAQLPEGEPCIDVIVLPADRSAMTADNFLPGYVVQYASWPPNGFPILTNSTVPIFAIPVEDTGAANSNMLIDLLGNSTVDENGILWWWLVDLYIDAAVLVLSGDDEPVQPIPAGAELPSVLQLMDLILRPIPPFQP